MLFGNFKQKVFAIEGFNIIIRKNTPSGDSRKIRADANFHNTYPYTKKAPKDMTVNEYLTSRISPIFPPHGYTADVLLGNGSSASGNTKLVNVRQTYQPVVVNQG